MTVCGNVLESIGNTPMIRLARMDSGLKSQVFAKYEGTNPGGSIKDRAALFMIRDAEARGALKKGMTPEEVETLTWENAKRLYRL